jgi:hypothetical protein
MQPEFSEQIFENNIKIQNFTKILPVGAELFLAERRTDMMKSVAFRSFANAPKMMRLFDAGSCSLYNQLILIFAAFVQPEALLQCTLNIFPPRSNLCDSS